MKKLADLFDVRELLQNRLDDVIVEVLLGPLGDPTGGLTGAGLRLGSLRRF